MPTSYASKDNSYIKCCNTFDFVENIVDLRVVVKSIETIDVQVQRLVTGDRQQLASVGVRSNTKRYYGDTLTSSGL